jgi:hypothetical protein
MMTKVMKKTVLVVCSLALMGSVAWATDYSKVSTQELSTMRGTLYNASQEEWLAFHKEWQKRLSLMKPEEMQKYAGFQRGAGWGRGFGGGPCWRMARGMGPWSMNRPGVGGR